MLAGSRTSKGLVFATLSFFALVAVFVFIQRSRRESSRNVIEHITDNSPFQQGVHPLGEIIKGKKVATIIETRPLDTLVPLILHFSAVLGPEWPIVVFTGPSPPPAFKSAAIKRLTKDGLIHIVPLTADVKFFSAFTVSDFLTNTWFWEQLAPADHVLLFQADSILCGNSDRSVNEFLEYDFIGAPVSMFYGVGFNGGLSLRNRNMMLSVIEQFNFTAEFEYWRDNPEDKSFEFHDVEDQWYYKKMAKLPPKEDGQPAAHLPSFDVAASFAVEAMWSEHPLGYHQVERWQSENLANVDKWCPEWKLTKEGSW
jgi:hypothetical protein